ncbi:hypothetical protein [Parabacteroides sp. ZJ-118]|uniref:hypothetical protein n=1 Tax=Parabacteroides sp. ZJ-118 TaxID=2709398 RepID=UPI00197CFC3C|nr:hypothetical protein [Parabacteroides sp. ZJ-118]
MNEHEISICFIVDVGRQCMQWSTQSKDIHITPVEQGEESIVERGYFSADRTLFITND